VPSSFFEAEAVTIVVMPRYQQSRGELVERAAPIAAAAGCCAVQISSAVFDNTRRWKFAVLASAFGAEAVEALK
jgi:hypothetical protein